MKLTSATIRTARGGAKLLAVAFAMLIGLSFRSELRAQEPASPSPAEEEDLGKDSSTEINVKNADLTAIVRIFSKKTKRNYILDENLKGKVSIYLPGKVSSDEAIRILDAVLSLKGFSSVPIGENLWKIVQAKDAKQSTIPTLTEDREGAPSAAMVTRLIPLKYVDAEDVQKLVSQLISANGLISAYTGTNSLMIIDSEDNIERVVNIINSMDLPFSDREMTIIPIKNADAKEIAEKLNEILGTGSTQDVELLRGGDGRAAANRSASFVQPPTGAAPGVPGGAPQLQTFASSSTVSARTKEPKIIADERTNSIIVIADEDTTARVRALISQLDSKVDLSGSKFYVYRCQHAKADDLAQVLSGLTGGGGGGSSAQGGTAGSVAFNSDPSGTGSNSGSRNRGDRFNRTQNRLEGQQRTPGRSRLENRARADGVGSVQLGEDISITADPATNSLIISASKTDYIKIKALIDKLDIKRRQVLVEAMLLEVGIDDSNNISTEFLTSAGGTDGGALIKSDFGNLATLLSNPTQLSAFSVAAASSGTLSLPGDITIPTQTVLLQAAQRNSNVNVLSAPNILTTDNEEAEIVVGQNIPFVASRSTDTTNLNNTFNQIDRQDVGITLRLTPQISSEDYVNLRIFTEVSDVIAATLTSDLGPTTTIRTSETTVITKDGQMIVTGGLMSDGASTSDTGVPFLMDIPVLGHIFRSASEARRRTNLLIFITPRIVKDQFDARDATVAGRDRMENEIERNQSYPERKEILRSKNMDRVAEASQFEGEKPSTIRGRDNAEADLRAALKPKRATRPAEEAPGAFPDEAAVSGEPAPSAVEPVEGRADAKGEIKESSLAASTGRRVSKPPAALEEPSTDEEAIELTVSPKLPDAVPPGFIPGGAEKMAGAAGARASSGPPGKFVIMELDGKPALPEGLPFHVDKKSSRVGLFIPGDSGALAKLFFRAGESYGYSLNGKSSADLKMKPLGIFNTAEEADAFYGGLADNWYTLSPYEIINIGKSPWMKLKQ